jgi:hypothetical protein
LNGSPDTRAKKFQEAQDTFREQWDELLQEEVTVEVPVIPLEDLEKCNGALERNQQGQITKRGTPTVRILMQLDWLVEEPAE